jgi:hypothetical protein
MHGASVGFGINGDGTNTETPCGARNAHCDLTAIGYQDLFKHIRDVALT